uniref:Zinc finger and SCAN domain-containing protein 22-like n=1 Tax=Gouania willdenowi TaxID=441366 RepID=A0A8C5I4W7_GOUWI
MTKLQFLNVFLTERLMLAAQEIYKSVEDTILEYQEEIAIRERENDHLRRRLRDAGIEIWPVEPQYGTRRAHSNSDQGQERSTFEPGAGPAPGTRLLQHIREYFHSLPEQRQGSRSSSGPMIGPKGPGTGLNRGQGSHMRNQGTNAVECPHQKSPLQAHMSTFCCKVCGEAFSHVGHLHVHVQVHTREKPYRCGVCGKCCSSSGRLQEHQRSHTGEKPFRCQICGKGFTQMAHLKVHMRIHTGEKPYSCPVCGKCFSRSDKIKRHLQTHSREGSYFSGQ